MTKNHRFIIILVSILIIAILEFMAIKTGIDGKMFGLVIAAIAGLAGFNLKEFFR